MNIKKERLMSVLLISMLFLGVFTVTVPRVRAYEYPPLPLVKVTLDEGLSGTFTADVMLMGEGGVDLDPFWDIGGFDITMNFPPALTEALDVVVDPDGWFGAFWPAQPPIIFSYTIDNAAGTVHVYVAGLSGPGGAHTPPFGRGRLFSVTFSAPDPPVPVEITLKNPRASSHRATLDADAGLINLASPVGTQWTAINPVDHGTPFSMDGWVDVDGDGELGPGDELILTNTTSGMWHRYEMHDILGTLTLAQQQFSDVDLIWMANFPNSGLSNNGLPGRTVTDSAEYNGFGTPYWTGNFSLNYPIDYLNAPIIATFLPFTGDEYTQVLVEGVDYKVHADEDLIELLVPLDVPIINEHWVDGVNNTLNGWPYINYVASGIESVYRKFPAYNAFYGETEGFATNVGYSQANAYPNWIGGEWWYDPDWPWELEGWWALGYGGLAGPWTWPDSTEWWINYTAASYITVDYAADFDPRPYSVEFDGTYDEFLALGDPADTVWNEVYPNSLGVHNLTDWTDSDSSGDITVGDYVDLEGAVGIRTYLVESSATDIIVDQIVVIDNRDPESPFYEMEPTVRLSGFPHPDREMSPWHNEDSSMPIPHGVENAVWPDGPWDPVVDFTASPRYAKKTSTEVTFDATSSYDPDGEIVLYEWDFGDGTTATSSPIVEHRWRKKGFYEVSLKVTDNDGLIDVDSMIMAVHPLDKKVFTDPKNLDWSEDFDGMMDLWAKVRNDGTAEVNVKATFTTYDRRTMIRVGPILEATGTSTPGSRIDLMVHWDPYDFDWTGTKQRFEVFAQLYFQDGGEWIFCGSAKKGFHVVP